MRQFKVNFITMSNSQEHISMGKKKKKPSRKNKTEKKKNNPTNQEITEEKAHYGSQIYEKYAFLTIYIGSIVFLFIYLGGLIMFLIK
ncbi:hypothetical protein [uncultured Methanobacterium sp.]|uniref:hypothetical protein n=1 Tax=uncultured Methanobacterium sp. TaxID=176306 RepID=UPI002AA62648|nr:hypothetical protein [uncultured Methanobacterium sp.]